MVDWQFAMFCRVFGANLLWQNMRLCYLNHFLHQYFQNHSLFQTFLHLPQRHHHDISHHEISHHRDNIIVAKLAKLSKLGDAVVSRLWWQVELEK